MPRHDGPRTPSGLSAARRGGPRSPPTAGRTAPRSDSRSADRVGDRGGDRHCRTRNAHARQLGVTAYLTAGGDLVLDGHDLGPATARLTGRGECEWVTTVRSANLPALAALLDSDPGVSLLDVLEVRYTGAAAAELEGILSTGTVPVERSTYSG